jgi:hypothetical protein
MKKFILIFIILIAFFLITLKKDTNMIETIKKALRLYSRGVVNNAEKIFRLETNHFKSLQFQKTFSAGMQATGLLFPYGWSSLKRFWNTTPQYKPIGTEMMQDNQTKKTVSFVKFPTFEAAFISLCEILQKRNNNAGAYFSNLPEKQDYYIALISKIDPLLTNSVV